MFEGSVLYISLRSPFARRVRIALREAGVRYEEKVVDLFGDVAKDAPDLFVANPLGRVPVWVPAKGSGLDAISESAEILALFYEVSQNQKDRGVQDVFKERLKDHRKSGLAVGLCEAVVARYLERMKSSPSSETLFEIEENIERTLRSLGLEVFNVPAPSSTLTQGQIDLICALDYLHLRMGENEEVQALFKRAEVLEFVRSMHERPAVKETFPPK